MRVRPGLKVIAERAGVSVATVSRVLNDRPEVNQATRERVLKHAADVEHETHQNRQSTTRTLKIGFVNDYRRYRLDSSYVGGLLTGVHAAASGHSYGVTLIDGDLIEREIRWPSRHNTIREFAGLIWSMPVFEERHRVFLMELGVPVVVINNLRQGVRAPFIESDNLTAARQGGEYLVGMGHVKIGFIGGVRELANFADRTRGYYQHMKEYGLEVDPDWVVDDLSQSERSNAVQAAHRLVGRRNLPTALICASETITIGVYDVLAERGISIPADMSILGFDDSAVSENLSPRLTTFRQHLDRTGEHAVDLLMDLLHHPDHVSDSPHRIEPMTLIVRDSVRAIEEQT